MSILNRAKVKNIIPPTAIKDNAAFVSNVITLSTDAPKGCRGIWFLISLGATDIAMAVQKVMQSDTLTDATTLGGTPTAVHDFTTKASATDDGTIASVYVPMSAITNLYVQLQCTAGDGTSGTYASAIAIFDAPGECGPTATLTGCSTLEIAS